MFLKSFLERVVGRRIAPSINLFPWRSPRRAGGRPLSAQVWIKFLGVFVLLVRDLPRKYISNKSARSKCRRKGNIAEMARKSAVQKIGGRCRGKMMMLCNESAAVMITYFVLVSSIMGLAGAVSRGGLQSEDSAPPSKVQKCREGCLDKVSI